MRAVPQVDAAPTRTTISPSPARGTGICSMRRSSLPCRTAANIVSAGRSAIIPLSSHFRLPGDHGCKRVLGRDLAEGAFFELETPAVVVSISASDNLSLRSYVLSVPRDIYQAEDCSRAGVLHPVQIGRASCRERV